MNMVSNITPSKLANPPAPSAGYGDFLFEIKAQIRTVTPQLPASYRNDLPSPEQISARLQGWAGKDD